MNKNLYIQNEIKTKERMHECWTAEFVVDLYEQFWIVILKGYSM